MGHFYNGNCFGCKGICQQQIPSAFRRWQMFKITWHSTRENTCSNVQKLNPIISLCLWKMIFLAVIENVLNQTTYYFWVLPLMVIQQIKMFTNYCFLFMWNLLGASQKIRLFIPMNDKSTIALHFMQHLSKQWKTQTSNKL